MKRYKLWIEIEEYDDETEEYRDVSREGEAEPVPLGEYESLEEAVSVSEALGQKQQPNPMEEP